MSDARRTCTTATAATTSVAAGSLVATLLETHDITSATMLGGAMGALIASMVLCSGWVTRRLTVELRRCNRPADKAFELGYDMGYDKAWNEARLEQQPHKIGLAAVDGEAVSR